jgi:hypothetical protein
VRSSVIVALLAGAVALASCTAILGDVPTTGQTSSGGGPGSGGSSAGGATPGSSGAGGGGGQAGGPTSAGGGGAAACSTCNDFLDNTGDMNNACPGSAAKFNDAYNCVCVMSCTNDCVDSCHGGTPSSACSMCASANCMSQLSTCTSDPGCLKCMEMFSSGDKTIKDACLGSKDAILSLYACACAQDLCTTECTNYCNNAGPPDDTCIQCLSDANTCGMALATCMVN